MQHARRHAGFTLVELMITLAIIALMMVLAVPSFGSASRAARERSAVQKLVQDFAWARGAAGAGDQAALNSSLTAGVTPTLTLTLNADCSWTTAISGTTDSVHSMTTAALSAQAPGIACAATGLTLPATFTFTAQGFVDKTGGVTLTGASGQVFPLTIFYSGSIIRTSPVAGVQS